MILTVYESEVQTQPPLVYVITISHRRRLSEHFYTRASSYFPPITRSIDLRISVLIDPKLNILHIGTCLGLNVSLLKFLARIIHTRRIHDDLKEQIVDLIKDHVPVIVDAELHRIMVTKMIKNDGVMDENGYWAILLKRYIKIWEDTVYNEEEIFNTTKKRKKK